MSLLEVVCRECGYANVGTSVPATLVDPGYIEGLDECERCGEALDTEEPDILDAEEIAARHYDAYEDEYKMGLM